MDFGGLNMEINLYNCEINITFGMNSILNLKCKDINKISTDMNPIINIIKED